MARGINLFPPGLGVRGLFVFDDGLLVGIGLVTRPNKSDPVIHVPELVLFK